MNLDQARAQMRPIVHILGTALILIAALKMFGMHIPVTGNISELALVGIGLMHI